jgi:hypothetical protein
LLTRRKDSVIFLPMVEVYYQCKVCERFGFRCEGQGFPRDASEKRPLKDLKWEEKAFQRQVFIDGKSQGGIGGPISDCPVMYKRLNWEQIKEYTDELRKMFKEINEHTKKEAQKLAQQEE